MKCDHAVQLCTCCICPCIVRLPSVDWRFFSRQPQTCLNSDKKITSRQGLKNAENSNCSSSNGFGPTLTTMTKPSAGWTSILTNLCAVSPRHVEGPPICLRVNHVVIFFVALKLVSFSLSYLLTARNGSVFFSGPCQVSSCNRLHSLSA